MISNQAEDTTPESLALRLREAEAKMAEQEAQLAELRGQLGDTRFVGGLRETLVRMGAASQLSSPVTYNQLLDLIISTAAQVLYARAASLFLIDFETDELVYEVALGESAEQARKFRVPMGQGIAGHVASTGESVLVEDARQDPRFAANIAEAIGYVPTSVLCIPFRLHGTVIGVIEAFDKAGGQPFNQADLDVLNQFASAGAVAIEQSRRAADARLLFRDLLQALLPDDPTLNPASTALLRHAYDFANRTASTEEYRYALEMTRRIGEIGRHGPAARELCEQIMVSLADFARSNTGRAGPQGARQ